MPNPNSPENRAKKAAEAKAEAAFLADLAEAEAKAAEGDTIGTAEKPVEASINAGPLPSLDNKPAKWAEEVETILAKFSGNDRQRLKLWFELGGKLSSVSRQFEKMAGRIGIDGKAIKDNNAYNDWIKRNGFDKGILSNANTRSAAKWLAEHKAEVLALPAALKHNHPVHAKQAVLDFWKACKGAKVAYDGDDVDPEALEAFRDAYEPASKSKGASTAPHSKDTYLQQFRKALAGGADILTLAATGKNQYEALIDLLRIELSKAQSEVLRLSKDLEDRGFDAAAPKAETKRSRKAAKAAPPKTENGDERVPGEVELWQGSDADKPIDVDFEQVVPPAQGLLPPPEADDSL